MTIEVPVWMLTTLLLIGLGGGLYTIVDHVQRANEETKSYSEFMRSRHRIINPKKKDKDKE